MGTLPKTVVELRMAYNIVIAMMQDIETFEANWPRSKRGSRLQMTWDSLLRRRDALEQCLRDAIEASGDIRSVAD